MISANLQHVKENMKSACERAGRSTEEVTLIAVSKTKPVSALKEAYDCGVRDFGENKVQELTEKEAVLPKDIRWHMIGHLQRNKVKYVVGKAYLIHSVDSVRLAEEISKEAVKKDVIADILIEVNVAGEETKFGSDAEGAFELIAQIACLPGIRIKGLMTIAPCAAEAEENRKYF